MSDSRSYIVPTDAVHAVGRFDGQSVGYVIRPPYGDGRIVYMTRREAMDMIANTLMEEPDHD